MPKLGDFFVVLRGRSWTARLIEWVTGSWAYHAGVFVGEQDFIWQGRCYHAEPAVMEGRPGGAGFAPVTAYPDAVWSTRLYDSSGKPLFVTDAQRHLLVAAALGMKGTEYGWLNCFCIGLTRLFHWHATTFMRRVLRSKKWAECAQLVAIVYSIVGLNLFVDGRPEGLVAPSDLLHLIDY